MKKSIYFAALLIAAGLTACDNYDEPNPPAQSNPEEPVFQTGNVAVTPSQESEAIPVDLKDLNDNGKDLALCQIVAPDIPTGYELKAVMEVSTDKEFTSPFDVPTTTSLSGEAGIYNISVSPDVFSGLYKSHVSLSPDQANLCYRYKLYVVSGKTEARVGGPEVYYGPYEMTLLPLPNSYTIEQNYYLVGTASDGTVKKGIKFDHSDLNQYDDPVFTVQVDVTEAQAEAGWKWMVIPESTFATGELLNADNTQFGPVAKSVNALRGDLTGVKGDYGVLKVTAPFTLQINMEDLTYTFTPVVDNLWVPGDANGFFANGMAQALYTTDNLYFCGYAQINKDFLLTTRPDMKGVVFGAAEKEGTFQDGVTDKYLTVKEPGLYWVTADLRDDSYTTTEIKTIGIIGDFNGWAKSDALTPSADGLTWTIKDVKLTEGQGWKFRANDDWGINLGGLVTDLTQGGDNLKVTKTGTYDITLHLDVLPYSCTLTAK